MKVAFHVHCVAVEDMEDFWLVGFADEQFGTKQYLMLQRSFADDEQDVRLGMNTYHVERDDQGWGCYGGIERFELYRESIQVVFDKTGKKCLGKLEGLEISFAVSGREFQKLKHRLKKVFAGSDCLIDCSN